MDAVGLEERAASFTKRSVKGESKLILLFTAIKMVDLTTLEGADTENKVRQLCHKACYPISKNLQCELNEKLPGRVVPSVAAVCVYPRWVKVAADSLKNESVNIASVATAFPSGQLDLRIKLQDVKSALESGADEIDMVIDRGAFFQGKYQIVFDEIVAVKELCAKYDAHLKVILETGELGSYDNIRLASDLSMLAGADFIKTSTGKIKPAATLSSTLVMLEAIRDYYQNFGVMVGMKPAGGIANSKLALHYLCMLQETLGEAWMTPKMFRFGASRLLNDLLRQVFKQASGEYYYDKVFSVD